MKLNKPISNIMAGLLSFTPVLCLVFIMFGVILNIDAFFKLDIITLFVWIGAIVVYIMMLPWVWNRTQNDKV